MGAREIPLGPGDRHVVAFERAGWYKARKQGSHVIMSKAGTPVNLSIPCHGGSDVPRSLIHSLVKAAGLTEAEYKAYYEGKRK